MDRFLFGVLVGIALIGIATYTIPLTLIGVQKELVAQSHATYHPLTKNFTLKECK